MPDHSEPCYSHEIFVPREIIFEICTVAEHLKYWWPDAENAVKQTSEPFRVVYTLQQSNEDTDSIFDVTFVLQDLGGSARIDVHQPDRYDETDTEQVTMLWRQRFAAMENYLSNI